MATHMPFSSTAALSGNSDGIQNLIHVVSKLASETDGPLRVAYTRGPDNVIPHFTEWKNLSAVQKARIFDLLIDIYENNLGNAETDLVNKTDPAFISCTKLRKRSAQFSTKLMEGAVRCLSYVLALRNLTFCIGTTS